MTTQQSVAKPVAQDATERIRILWKSWTRPGAIFYASTMLANAAGYVFFVIMARLLTVPEYGELVTLTALVYVFGVITRSLQAKVAQGVTAFKGSGLEATAAAGLVLRQAVLPVLGGATVLLSLGALVSPWLASFLRLDSPVPILLLASYVASHFLLAAPRGLLLGTGRLYYLSTVTVLDPLVRVAIGVLLVAGPLRTTGALLAYTIGNLAAATIAVAPFALLAFARARERLQPTARWLTYDRQFIFAVVVNSALMLLASVDPVAIRRLFSETVAGNFAVAFLLGRIILLSTNAASWVVFSRAVHLRPNEPAARSIVLRGLALGCGIAALITLGYWIAPDLAARAIGGNAFQGAAGFVGLVGLEMVVFSFVSILAYYHIAIRNTRILLPFALALALEAILIMTFNAMPFQIVFNTTFTLTALAIWIGVETIRKMRPSAAATRSSEALPRVCMVVHSHYPQDARVRREAMALIDAGWQVDVICVPDGNQGPREVVEAVRVYRMPLRRNVMGSKLSYLLEYGRFFLTASLTLSWLHLRRSYHVVQVHNMPDFLVFTAWLPKLLGARVVLDVHDLVPEFYALRYRLPLDHPVVRLTRVVQRASSRFADHVITAGEPFRRVIMQAGLPASRVTSVMNSPDPVLFQPRANGHSANGHHGRNGRFILSYHGTLSEYNDLGLVLRAVNQLRDEIPGLEFHVYGRGRSLPQLKALARDLNLETHVKFMGFQPLDDMPGLISHADLGLAPQCKSTFTALNYPTKAFEYIVLGVPVLMSRSPALVELFGPDNEAFFEPDSPGELASRIRALYSEPLFARRLLTQQQRVCASFAWPVEKLRYVAVMTAVAQAQPVRQGADS
jgi:glycosyltransferase involved in cell wall biosynthesis/O-antigen/teichoic acid export membrane protein